MISERTLRNWRREALKEVEFKDNPINESKKEDTNNYRFELYDRILRLTQELLDQHLLRKT